MMVLKAAIFYSHVIDKNESGDVSASLNVSVC